MSIDKKFNGKLKLTPIILAGGTGTRLWPLSRESYPKQFLKLTSHHSLLQDTLLRVQMLENISEPIIISNEAHYFLCLEQLEEIGISSALFILEPFGKNTAPAIACAAHHLSSQSDAFNLMLVMPSDHQITNSTLFVDAVKNACEAAYNSDKLVTFGVIPTTPKTGYGYIESSEEKISSDVYNIKKFIEKPTLEIAKELIKNNHVFWNSGIFLFKPESYLEELKYYAPDIYETSLCTYTFSQKNLKQNYIALDRTYFANCPNDSIDYAVMEKTKHAAVVPLKSDWTDLGCWATVAESLKFDKSNNVINGNILSIETENCFLSSEKHLVATLGIKNQIIVSTEDAVLIADKAYSQDVKNLVNKLKISHNHITKYRQTVYHPWGYEERLVCGNMFQVKHIMVKSEAKLPVQMHSNRSKHWVILYGEAEVVNGEQKIYLGSHQSTYIPIETKHRLSNIGKEDLCIIEIQSGNCLGDKDIIEYRDEYNFMPLSDLESAINIKSTTA